MKENTVKSKSFNFAIRIMELQKLETSEEFSQALEKGQNIEDFYDPYVYSYYMIDSLVDLKGKEIITDLILESKDGNFYESFEKLVGVDIKSYQKVDLVEYIVKNEEY